MFYEKSNEVEFHRTQSLDKNLGFFLTDRAKGFQPFSDTGGKVTAFPPQQRSNHCRLAFSVMRWGDVHGGYVTHVRVLQKCVHGCSATDPAPQGKKELSPGCDLPPPTLKSGLSRGADWGKIAGVVHSFLHRERAKANVAIV